VSPDSPFIGKTIKELDPLRHYNINIAKIVRGHKEIYFPKGKDFIYPSDRLVLIGTDEQVAIFSKIIEIQEEDTFTNKHEIELSSFVVKEDSPILGKNITNSGVRLSGCLIIKVDRGDEVIINPHSLFIFELGDLIWIAGEREKIQGFV
jgi:CPA2 family monovalent cation:H+ antiporter-2